MDLSTSSDLSCSDPATSSSQDESSVASTNSVDARAPAPTDVPLPPKPKPLVPLDVFGAPPPKKSKSSDSDTFAVPPPSLRKKSTSTSTADVTTEVALSSEISAESLPTETVSASTTDNLTTEEIPIYETTSTPSVDSSSPATESSPASTPTTSSTTPPSTRKPISNLTKRPSIKSKSSTDVQKKSRFRPPPKAGSEYIVPFWSAIPEHPYKLEVLKAGSIRSILDINLKTHYTFGRLATCDMVMEHQSVSRKHAVIQFRDNSTVYLYDLGSTHGSFVNKRRIPPHIYTELKVGDLISFGASTRRYILDGPEALRPQGKRQIPLLLDENNNLTTELPTHFVWTEDETQGVTWGVATGVETAIQKEIEAEQERANRKYEKTDSLSDRQKKLLERMELREKKIANIRTEMANLQAKQEKQNGELTDGQKARIAQCEQIIEKLEEQKESLKDTIHDSFEDAERRSQKKKVNPLLGDDDEDEKKRKRKKKLNDFSDSDEEDEFYDRTVASETPESKSHATSSTALKKRDSSASTSLTNTASAVSTAASTNKKDPLILARAAFKSAQMELDNVESRSFKLSLQLRDFDEDAKRRKKQEEENDSLDAFMSGITSVVKKDKRKEIEEELKKLQLKKAHCELDLKEKQAVLVQAEYTQAGSLEAAKNLREKHEQERKETKRKEEEALIDKSKKIHKVSSSVVTAEASNEKPKETDSEDKKTRETSKHENDEKDIGTVSSQENHSLDKTDENEGNGEDSELARIRARIEAQRKIQKEAKKRQAADATLAFVRLGKEKQAERERAKEEKERYEMEKELAAAALEKQKMMEALEEEEKRKAVDPLERIRAAFDRKKAVTAPDDEFAQHAKRKLLQTRQLVGDEDSGISAGLHLRKKVKEAPVSDTLEFAPATSSPVVPEPKPRKVYADLIDDGEVKDVTWVPPVNQRGDGKTHLNAKFGY